MSGNLDKWREYTCDRKTQLEDFAPDSSENNLTSYHEEGKLSKIMAKPPPILQKSALALERHSSANQNGLVF
jgi:hypothetical protein